MLRIRVQDYHSSEALIPIHIGKIGEATAQLKLFCKGFHLCTLALQAANALQYLSLFYSGTSHYTGSRSEIVDLGADDTKVLQPCSRPFNNWQSQSVTPL
ncbi:hypothetical protein KC19_12G041500 [Ceratodon purpureus]|uniref:Uncharacterized protein n=1 Tax=Ceratodon purpureus TaxID=3225 RepID=A0A8T0G3E7_CERPU|nr:hypothetical protein KC19_12G041500 [Ceratodon purpureus]